MAGKEIIMADKKYLIEINHVGKKFGDLTVLKDISVKVKEKEVGWLVNLEELLFIV